MAFDNDDIFEDNDDEDLKTDPISQMDMQVALFIIVPLGSDVLKYFRNTSPHSCENVRPGTRPIFLCW